MNQNARLSEAQVRQIRLWRSQGKSLSQIAALAHTSKSRVSLICSGKSWKHVT